MGGMAAVHGKQLSRDGFVVPLFLLPYSVVVRMLAPAAAAVMITVEALAPGALGTQPRQLPAMVGGDLEETRPAAVQDHGEQSPELLFDRRELAYQRCHVDSETRTMHHRQRNHFEQADSFAGEDGKTLGMRKIAWGPEELLHPVEVPRYLVGSLPIQPDPG
jgi:hypothetical protein